MMVPTSNGGQGVGMKNHWFTAVLGVCVWLVVVVVDVAPLVLIGFGKA